MPLDAFKGMEFLYPIIKNVEQGAITSIWAAVDKVWKHKGGKYLANYVMVKPYMEGDDKVSSARYSPYAYDMGKAKRL